METGAGKSNRGNLTLDIKSTSDSLPYCCQCLRHQGSLYFSRCFLRNPGKYFIMASLLLVKSRHSELESITVRFLVRMLGVRELAGIHLIHCQHLRS